MRKMIAYCGLDCEKCDAYLATVHDDQASRRYGNAEGSDLRSGNRVLSGRPV